MNQCLLALSLLLASGFVSCGAALNIGGGDQAGDATVTGVVKFKGEQPPRDPIKEMTGNAFCKEACKDNPPPHEKWVFGKNGDQVTFQNVLVHVTKGLEGKTFTPPATPVVIDQVKCVYTPHVVAVMAGQPLEIRNSDEILHNVLANPRSNAPFNEGMPSAGTKIVKLFKNPEMKLDLRCFMHPWMVGYVHVMAHPYYAVTQTDGTFTIKGLPPGDYELSVVHESSRFAAEPATVTVKVAAGETKKIEFTYELKKN